VALAEDAAAGNRDLRALAARLEAGREGVFAARAPRLPSVNLGMAGSGSGMAVRGDDGGLSDFSRNEDYRVAVNATWELDVWGRLAARQASALEDAAVESLAGVVLKAFREVESALAAGQSLERQQALLAKELEQAELAERQASREYSQGAVSYLSVLEAQRRAVTARSQNISMQNARLLNRIDLHLAIGGDFTSH
jgi:outer membrane protein TolC